MNAKMRQCPPKGRVRRSDITNLLVIVAGCCVCVCRANCRQFRTDELWLRKAPATFVRRLLVDLTSAVRPMSSMGSSVRYSECASRRIQHSVCDSVVHKIGTSSKFQFFINSFPIGLDGFFTYPESHCNCLRREPLCNSSQDLRFTAAEPLHPRFAYCGSLPADEHVRDGVTEPRIKVSSTAMNHPNRFVQLRIAG